MRFDIVTIFPEVFEGIFSCGIISRSLKKGLITIHVHQLRDYCEDIHKKVDDRPFSGGSGMVFKPEPIFKAVEAISQRIQEEKKAIILLSPQGIDERVRQHLITDELSIGDYVLTGGEIAAMAVVDAVTRSIPQSLGSPESAVEDSFYNGLLDYPHYTRPANFRRWKVPQVLLSGDHEAIRLWKKKKILENTWKKRPDLLIHAKLDEESKRLLDEIKKEGMR